MNCEYCNTPLNEDNHHYFDGTSMCDNCHDERVSSCEHCGQEVWTDDNSGCSRTFLCKIVMIITIILVKAVAEPSTMMIAIIWKRMTVSLIAENATKNATNPTSRAIIIALTQIFMGRDHDILGWNWRLFALLIGKEMQFHRTPSTAVNTDSRGLGADFSKQEKKSS